MPEELSFRELSRGVNANRTVYIHLRKTCNCLLSFPGYHVKDVVDEYSLKSIVDVSYIRTERGRMPFDEVRSGGVMFDGVIFNNR